MTSRSALAAVNRPDAFEVIELEGLTDGVKKIIWEMDTRAPCCGIFHINLEDDTLGHILKIQLLRDSQVTFAGYIKPHPLENKIEMRVQTREDSTPFHALHRALVCLAKETKSMKSQFKASFDICKANQKANFSVVQKV
eukprot:Lankesteria_metandrocarpae@DN5195_c0_g1_i3.p3